MNTAFTPEEIRFLRAWASDEHGGRVGPARAQQRAHGVNAAVIGQLVARLSTALGRTQQELVEEPIPVGGTSWPWPASLEARLQQLLPESTIKYLEDIGALKVGAGAADK